MKRNRLNEHCWTTERTSTLQAFRERLQAEGKALKTSCLAAWQSDAGELVMGRWH